VVIPCPSFVTHGDIAEASFTALAALPLTFWRRPGGEGLSHARPGDDAFRLKPG